MPYITLETYPPVMLDYENHVENPDYDEQILIFTVPYHWLSDWYKEEEAGEFDLDYFLINEYTWDDTLAIYEQAYTDGVIVEEHIGRR